MATVHGVDRWDACTTPHAHFICEKCNAVIDVDVSTEDVRAALEQQSAARCIAAKCCFADYARRAGKKKSERLAVLMIEKSD